MHRCCNNNINSNFYFTMKKLLKRLIEAIELEGQTDDFRTNQMLNCTFTGKTTNESIKIFESYKKSFEAELSKRNLNAEIERSDIDNYFENTKAIKVNNFEIVEPLKN